MFDKNHVEFINKIRKNYKDIGSIICPALNNERVYFNSNGFNHLQYHVDGSKRSIEEQRLKLSLFPLAIPVICQSKEIEGYRFRKSPTGSNRKRGVITLKNIHYWSIVSDVGHKKISVRVVLRKVGDGILHFWSIMKI